MAMLYRNENIEVFFINEKGEIIKWEDVRKINNDISILNNDDASYYHDYLATRNN